MATIFFLAKHGNVQNGEYMFESTICIQVYFELSLSFYFGIKGGYGT